MYARNKTRRHDDPALIASSVLFAPSQRSAVLLSDMGIIFMAWVLSRAVNAFGVWNVVKYYGIPWLEVTHWFIMITFVSTSILSSSVIKC